VGAGGGLGPPCWSTPVRAARLSFARSRLVAVLLRPRRGWKRQQQRGSSRGDPLLSSPAVVQDMAVTVAEAVAAVYLDEARSGLAGGADANVPAASGLAVCLAHLSEANPKP
jgi:hypothetical protein